MNLSIDTRASIHEAMVPQQPLPATDAHPAYTVSELECVACDDPKPVITVENLSVAYDGVSVLKNVSLQLNDGCITALIGPSGCGKTTFLSCLNRLIDFAPGSSVTGSVRIGDIGIWEDSVDVMALRRRVGMVFQRANPFPLSIRRNLEMPLIEHGVKDRQEIDRRIEQALCDVGLWTEVKDKLNGSALTLSGGQQQRLCIARALVLERSILLMDEPCSALDPMSSSVVEDLILRMKGRYTVVIVTHNLAQARRIANYVAFFWMHNNAGALVEFGRCQHIFETPSSPLTADYVSGLRG